MRSFYETNILAWAMSPIIVDAINAQNEVSADFDPARIDRLDRMWRDEIGAAERPTIDGVLNNQAADFLRRQVASSDGAITEVFIMDAQGLNVAASQVTSDYWQGDEAKHQATYGAGAGAVHFGDIELDESSQQYQGQISMTIVDSDTGQPVGAITVGVNASSLF